MLNRLESEDEPNDGRSIYPSGETECRYNSNYKLERKDTEIRREGEKDLLIKITDEDISKATKNNKFFIDLDNDHFTDLIFYSGKGEMKKIEFHIRAHPHNIMERLRSKWEGWSDSFTVHRKPYDKE